MTIYSIVGTDTSEFIHWQCELQEYSWGKSEQPGELIRLVAADPETELPVHKHAHVIRTQPVNIHPETGDHYVPYNRLYSLQEWLIRDKPSGTVLILDPDFVFRCSLPHEVLKGAPRGQHWIDFGLNERRTRIFSEISTADLSSIQPLTWPAFIHTDDLINLMPRWIELTGILRQKTKGWESDMYAFILASAELGLVYTLENFAAWMPWPEEKVRGAPIVHYCQAVRDRDDNIIWSKNQYRPWAIIEKPESAKLDYSRDLLFLVNEYAGLRNTALTHAEDTIFVAIASYCDPEIASTILNCIDKAMLPQNLRFGICLQYEDSGVPEIRQNCLDAFKNDPRFQITKYDYTESKGGCWARNLAQALYKGEQYTIQVDAHTQFVENWDMVLIQMLENLPSEKPLITGFPHLYTRDEDNLPCLTHLQDLGQGSTTIAKSWNKEGWVQHTHQYLPDNTISPRRARFISGAFVFTTGEWNEQVRQDPDHFYTGEEFALTLRSFAHGYDLFETTQIVVWHRLHPKANRKYWNDNDEKKTHERHDKAILRLQALLQGDPKQILGQYGLGNTRTLEDYRIYSGLDCETYNIHPDAKNGIPPNPVTLKSELNQENLDMTTDISKTEIELTIHFKGMDSLELVCEENSQILKTLFSALINQDQPEIIYLEINDENPRVLYFPSTRLAAIETNPQLTADFFQSINS